MSACNAGDLGLIPGSGRSPEERNGNPLQYSCLENPMDRGAWWAAVRGVTKSRTVLSAIFLSYFKDDVNTSGFSINFSVSQHLSIKMSQKIHFSFSLVSKQDII